MFHLILDPLLERAFGDSRTLSVVRGTLFSRRSIHLRARRGHHFAGSAVRVGASAIGAGWLTSPSSSMSPASRASSGSPGLSARSPRSTRCAEGCGPGSGPRLGPHQRPPENGSSMARRSTTPESTTRATTTCGGNSFTFTTGAGVSRRPTTGRATPLRSAHGGGADTGDEGGLDARDEHHTAPVSVGERLLARRAQNLQYPRGRALVVRPLPGLRSPGVLGQGAFMFPFRPTRPRSGTRVDRVPSQSSWSRARPRASGTPRIP